MAKPLESTLKMKRLKSSQDSSCYPGMINRTGEFFVLGGFPMEMYYSRSSLSYINNLRTNTGQCGLQALCRQTSGGRNSSSHVLWIQKSNINLWFCQLNFTKGQRKQQR